MPTAKVQKIESWSFSRYNVYEECPRKAKYKFIDRLKEPGSKAMDRGADIHLMAEHAVKGTAPKQQDFKGMTPALAKNAVRQLRGKTLPMELKNFEQEFETVRQTKGVEAELELAFTQQWDPCDWFGKETWVRIKIDLLIPPTTKSPVVEIIDHKTGRPRGTYAEQVELYAIGGLLRYPQAEVAKGRLWFLDEGKIMPEKETDGVYKRKDLPVLQKRWMQRVKPMLSDTVFAPKPGPACRYCHFRNANGGPCEF